jgi:hypothetical protein
MKRRIAWPGAVALVLAIAGCSKDETPPPAAKGDGTVKSVGTVVNGGGAFRLPFDAALAPRSSTTARRCSRRRRRAACRPGWPTSSRPARWT